MNSPVKLSGRYWHKHNIFDMNFKIKSKREPAIIWKRMTSKKYSTLMGSTPEARDTVRWYWSSDTLFWQLSIDDNIDLQSAFSWTPKVARKCESKHWYACGADGRSVGRSVARSLGHVITKFSGMGRFIYPWCSAGALRARSSANNRDLKHRHLNGRRRRFPTEADWGKGFVFGGENEV